MEALHTEAADRLFAAILRLQTKEECYALFEDLCTIREIRDLSQRYEVAVMLGEGKSYQEIAGKTGASTATICRVNKCLMYGTGGYRAALSGEEK
ncbi:MAG: TrpR YerC/YecD [Clostridia bacterium]|nr:TrpR YerC/YecD [Clostridia bacterium]